MKKRLAFGIILVSAIITIALTGSVYAADETDTSAANLVRLGIIEGDNNGNLNLENSLTRAELAAILTRMDFAASPGGLNEWNDWGYARFSSPEQIINTFNDIPAWALPYIEYCYEFSWMKGVSPTKFDAQGKVNPKMACTVILRYCEIPETDWNYDTSVEKAIQAGLAPNTGLDGNIIQRGTMAVLVNRAMSYSASDTMQDNIKIAEPPAAVLTPQPEPEVTKVEMTIEEMKLEIVRLTNTERVKAGLPELEILPELMDCAQAKAQDFFDNSYYSHTSPVYGTFSDMIRTFVPDAWGCGENIAPWRDSLEGVFYEWMDSQGHRDNILEPRFTHIGVGIVQGAQGGFWWVQQFIS